jgi:hypothetical protein
MERHAIPKLKNKSNGKSQKANGKSKENTKFENRNWKLKTQTHNARSPRGSLLHVLRFAFCVLPFDLF